MRRPIWMCALFLLQATLAWAGPLSAPVEGPALGPLDDDDRNAMTQWQSEHEIMATAIGDYLAQYLAASTGAAPVKPPAWFSPAEYDIPVTYNRSVQVWVDLFVGQGRTGFPKTWCSSR